jgi:hypothetical protein
VSASKEVDVGGNDVIAPSPAKGQRKILGQTRAAWYIYWICAVASIANMSVRSLVGYLNSRLIHVRQVSKDLIRGIYSIIISDSRFIDYFNVGGARAGVVASMGTF